MEWIFKNSNCQNWIPNGFLGVQVGETYEISSDCLMILSEISKNLLFEDKTMRNFRRSIALTETLKKDFIPILIHVKDLDVIDALIRILVNLSVPIECLLPVEVVSQTDLGRSTISELSSFLVQSKECFVDPRTTRVIIDYMKKIIEIEEKRKLSEKECDSINNCLLLLRNVLHIPEAKVTHCNIQNQIVWNLFVQNIDKVLIHLMTCEQKSYWGVTMVQLIAVMYKDQHVETLQKLLNTWFEASVSESSEDNESNTSPPEQGSDSSPVLTSSDPTSDSSDTGGGGHKSTDSHEGSSGVPHVVQRTSAGTNECNKPAGKKGGSGGGGITSNCERKTNSQGSNRKNKISNKKSTDFDSGAASSCSSEISITSKTSSTHNQQNITMKGKQSPDMQWYKRKCFSPEMSDCGYGTQAENPELVSTSSNEEETPETKRLVHPKPHIQKTRYCNKPFSLQEKKELRRKKLIKRSKTTTVNIKALAHHSPSNEDITHILKEFTVDFLLKAYSSLVEVLHKQILLPPNIVRIDTSHFFWLVTYFLKFAAQLELDLEHIREVLSYDIISYLTYEGVNICESLEIECRQENTDLKPYLRRQHLVVTAIKEFIQATETYVKLAHLNNEDRAFLQNLQVQISSTDDLKCLFVLLLRQYNPKIHNKQYLQDVIVTNHILLVFLENSSKLVRKEYGVSLITHIKQFATVDVMYQYGILLEDFESNGEYINDCVFTMMHHIGGDMNQVSSLFQPNILKTFTQIWEGDFQLCENWSDLIEYVIHRFINFSCRCSLSDCQPESLSISSDKETNWVQENCDSLTWFFAQRSTDPNDTSLVMDPCGQSSFTNNRIVQNSSNLDISDDDKMVVENVTDEINYLKDLLIKDNRGAQISWLQRLLIEVCYVKLVKDVDMQINYDPISKPLEPIPHYYSHLNQSIPIVSWNREQADVFLLQPFQLLLHKLGFHLPADTGKVFARIPSFWTVDVLFSVAQKLGPIVSSELKFEAKYLIEKLGDGKKQEREHKISMSLNHQYTLPKSKHHTCLIKHNALTNSTSQWFDITTQTKNSLLVNFVESKKNESQSKTIPFLVHKCKECDFIDSDVASVCSVCETNRESVASDLTKMCISDEEPIILP